MHRCMMERTGLFLMLVYKIQVMSFLIAAANYSDTSRGTDHWHPPYSPLIQAVGWLLAGALTFETIIGNALVLVAYYINSGIRKQTSNRFILSLAISDLIIGFEGIPLFTVYVINGDRWPLGAIACQTWLFLDYTLCLVSILTVLLITVDRYLSVCHTASYMSWQNSLKIQLMIIGSWIGPALMFGVMIYGWGWISGEWDEGHSNGECFAPFLSNPYVNMTMYLLYYWTTLVAMLILYNGIHRAAKKLEIKGKAKENRRIALLLTQRLGTQVGVGLMLWSTDAADAERNNAQKKVEVTTVRNVDAKDSGYNTNNTPSTHHLDLAERRRWSSCTNIDSRHRMSNGINSLLKTQPTPSTGASSCLKVPLEVPAKLLHIDSDVPSRWTDEETNLLDDELLSKRDLELTSINSKAFDEGSISSVLRLVSIGDGPFFENSDITSSDSTSLIILKNSKKHPGRRYSSMKSRKPPPESGITFSKGSRSLKERRHHRYSNRVARIRERQRDMECIVESIETADNSSKPKITRSRTLCVAREVRERRKSSTKSFLGDFQFAAAMKPKAERNWLDRLICWVFGISDDSQASDEPADIDDSQKTMNRSFSMSSSGSGDDDDYNEADEDQRPQEKRENHPLLVPKLTVTKDSHRPSVESMTSNTPNQRSRVNSGVSALFAVGTDPARIASAMKTTRDRLLMLSSTINVFNRRRKRTKAERRAAKAFRTITFIVGLFAILWSPYFLMATIYGFCKGECVPPFIYNICYYLCYLNSSGNPFMYALANNQFRLTFIQILKGNFKKI